MILRITTAALGLLALGGSINAVNAAEAVAVPAVAAATSAADLPRFQPSGQNVAEAFADTGAKAQMDVPADAADLGTIAPSDNAVEDLPAGVASWYGAELAGHRTATGERFNPADFTAAHRTLPLGSKVRVTYQGRSVVVRINDRGPFTRGRVIDLSRAAAEEIGLRRAGSGKVELARVVG
jgi:rare lipoprotein A